MAAANSTQRVRDALEALGLPARVQELPRSTRTAVEAAAAVGSSVGQIVKSLVFRTSSGKPLLILTSGANQVDEGLVSQVVGEKIQFADPDFVREQTGFAIGGVSPYGLVQQLPIYIDRDLLAHPLVWAAAGSPRAVFSIAPDDLVRTSRGTVIDVHP